MAEWLVWGINSMGTYTEHDCETDEEKDNLLEELKDEKYTNIDCIIKN